MKDKDIEDINFCGSKILMITWDKYGITGMRIEDPEGIISNIVFGVSVTKR